MRSRVSRMLTGLVPAACGALTLAIVAGPAESRAQAPTPPPRASWYAYVPGRGWVGYAPPSAPAAAPAVRYAPAPAPVAPAGTPAGWAGYAPATAWAGYAPASSTRSPAVRTPGSIPPGPQRRVAANRFVNGNAPGLSYTLPSYREYGSGRSVPLAKPWLPASP